MDFQERKTMDLEVQERKKMRRFVNILVIDTAAAQRMIIEEGIDVNADYNTDSETPLHFAIERNNLGAVQFLLERGAKINNENGWEYHSPLSKAIVMLRTIGRTCDILKLLLENGADCNERNFYGPLLALAFHVKNLEAVKLLLRHGAAATDAGGNTPLHHAVVRSKEDVIQFVLDQNCDIDRSNNGGWSALHHAVHRTKVAASELLLRHGADVNKRTNYGDTPLTLAVGEGSQNLILQLLLEYGANASHTRQGESVLQIATRSGNKENAMLLIEQLAIMECLNLDVQEYTRRITERNGADSRQRRDKAVELLGQQLAMMGYRYLDTQLAKKEYLDLVINACDRELIENDADYKEYYEDCLQELRNMKMAKFYNDVPIFYVFLGRDKLRSAYARNEDLVEALVKVAEEKCFPIYFSRLRKKFLIEVEKQKSRKTAAGTLSSLLGFNDPFRVVSQKILSYITDEDLKFLTI